MAENESTTTVVEADTSKQAPAVQPVIAAQEPTDQKDPQWLPARLERERRKLLTDLGVEKVDDAKAAIAELKKIRDAEKTETDRLRAEVESLKAQTQRMSALESAVSARAKAELASLTDAQREAVMAVAGDDASVQLKAVDMLRPTWTSAVAAAIAPPVKQAPANTAPSAKAPSASSPESENVLATYERLRATNPYGAARYRLQNLERYTEALKARE